jgi:hypothetical protein
MNNDKLIDKIIDSQDIKTVQLNFRNDTLTEQEFTLFDTNTLTQPEENITYNIPNGTIEYVDDLPLGILGAIYIPLVNKVYTGTGYANDGLYIKNINDNSVIQKFTNERCLGFVNNTNNEILYMYCINQDVNYPAYTYTIKLLNTSTDEIIASYNCPIFDIYGIDGFAFCKASNCIYYITIAGNQLYRFDCNTNTGSLLELPVDFQQGNWMEYNSVNGKLYFGYSSYVSPYFAVLIINPETNEIESLIDISFTAFGFEKSTFCSSNNSIYLTRGYGDVYIFDCNTNICSFLFNLNPSYLYIRIVNIIYNENNNQIYLIYSDSWYFPAFTGNFIGIIDCSTNIIINTLNSLQLSYYRNADICFFQNNQLVICWDNPYPPNDLWEGVDCNTDTNYVYLQYTGLDFVDLSISQQEQLLYVVCNSTPKTVLVYDLDYNLITSITISFTQYNALYNSILNQMFVYGFDGADIIDCATNTIIQSISFVSGGTGGVFNPVNNKYYLGWDDYYILEVDAVTYTQNVIVTPYLSANGGKRGMTIDVLNNTIYQIGYSDNVFWSYNITSGASTLLIDGNTLNISFKTIKFNPLNNSIYLVVYDANISSQNILVLNTDGVILNQLPLPLFYPTLISNMSFNPYNNTIVFCTNKNVSAFQYILTLNCTTNQVTYEPSFYFHSIDFNLLNNRFYTTSESSSGTFNLPSNLTSLVPLSNVYVSGGSIDYNFFVQTLINDPKLIYDILIKMPQRYLANPVNVIYTDANGQSATTPYLPNTDIDAFQKSPNRGIIKFENGLVLNINTQVQIIIPPLTTVILLLDYKEFIKSDMLDLVVYDDNGKAKYIIDENLGDRKIIAKKYWGSKSMPKNMVLDKEWLRDMRGRFSKVEVLEYDTPKLAGGTTEMRGVYQDLFGFKKQVKAKHIGITKPYKKDVEVKLSTKKQTIKPKSDYVQVEQVYQDLININAHEIPLEKISIPKIDKVKPAIVEYENITPIDVFNQSFEEYGNVYLVGVKQPCEEKQDEYVYGVYYIKENGDRFTAIKHSGDIPIKIELTDNWYNELKNKFDDIQVLTIVQKKI